MEPHSHIVHNRRETIGFYVKNYVTMCLCGSSKFMTGLFVRSGYIIKKELYIAFLIGAVLQLLVGISFGQDTIKRRTIDVTATFKPVLREAAKINFNATPPATDNAVPDLKYDIPNQNLALGFQPGSLKPLALQIDSGGRWDNNNYVKVGFGSLRTPFIQTGFSLGDGHTGGINIYAKHVSSDGIGLHDFSSTNVKLSGFFLSAGNLGWDGGLEMKQDKTYKYGYLPTTLVFPKDSLKQSFNTYGGRLSFHNVNKTAYNISYAPEVKINVFSDSRKNNESNTVVDLPLKKSFGKLFDVNLGVTFDLTRLSPEGKSAMNNTMYYLSPSVSFKTTNARIQAGIRPSWDNKQFKMFPNVLAEISTEDSRFTFHAGWTGYIRKTTYQYLASQNPWLWLPTSFKNTWIEERFAGFKGSVGDHFTYNAKVGYNKLNNQPLFVNDTATAGGGKSFHVVNEPTIKVLNLGGEFGINVQEKFSLLTGLTFNQYTGLVKNAKAWGLIPLELNMAMRLLVLKDLWLKTDLYAWSGPQYMKKNGSAGKLGGAMDLNAGLEFRITKYLRLWTQFNNILNKEYQRWNQYPVYGFNFTGGVVFSFDQKN